ncbi:hypothetical protein SEA_SAMISTI12_196 [Streptomyces phage Samisti12]|uniref:Uncharacterized protein n=1 Tax=Streptomyces phage Samisti12 TaxID=2023995 RepID=A0A223G071_9CAUD|nr:hypothetical protein FDI39_gp108 [Streptomyces phage Samisti12]AST15386.1 hypothetical protein SEA_SAMISTI12_196 [Streptomyces phage Samisti12]
MRHSPHCTFPGCKGDCLITITIDPRCLKALLDLNRSRIKTGTVGEAYALRTLRDAVK